MTRDQRISEIRKQLAIDERLCKLLVEHAKDYADAALRKQYITNDTATLIRQAGMAEGVEKFMDDITRLPNGAHPDRK